MSDKFILDGHKVVPIDDLMEWAKWFESADRIVAKTQVGDMKISTVFLSINHNFGDDRVPVLFETMVFGGKLDEQMERYSTWQDAEEGHKRWVAKAKESQ